MGGEGLRQASRDERIEQVLVMQARLEEAEAQLRGLKQQLFGAKSERRLPPPDPSQLSLGEGVAEQSEPTGVGTPVRAHVRRPRPEKNEDEDPGLRFDDTVPVQRIVVADPALEGLREGVDYTGSGGAGLGASRQLRGREPAGGDARRQVRLPPCATKARSVTCGRGEEEERALLYRR